MAAVSILLLERGALELETVRAKSAHANDVPAQDAPAHYQRAMHEPSPVQLALVACNVLLDCEPVVRDVLRAIRHSSYRCQHPLYTPSSPPNPLSSRSRLSRLATSRASCSTTAGNEPELECAWPVTSGSAFVLAPAHLVRSPRNLRHCMRLSSSYLLCPKLERQLQDVAQACADDSSGRGLSNASFGQRSRRRTEAAPALKFRLRMCISLSFATCSRSR